MLLLIRKSVRWNIPLHAKTVKEQGNVLNKEILHRGKHVVVMEIFQTSVRKFIGFSFGIVWKITYIEEVLIPLDLHNSWKLNPWATIASLEVNNHYLNSSSPRYMSNVAEGIHFRFCLRLEAHFLCVSFPHTFIWNHCSYIKRVRRQRFLRFQRFLSDQYLPGIFIVFCDEPTFPLILGVLFLPFSWKGKEKSIFKTYGRGKEDGNRVSACVKYLWCKLTVAG